MDVVLGGGANRVKDEVSGTWPKIVEKNYQSVKEPKPDVDTVFCISDEVSKKICFNVWFKNI